MIRRDKDVYIPAWLDGKIIGGASILLGLSLLAGCNVVTDQQPAPTIINNTPGDGGMLVLLTVAGIGLLFVVGIGVFLFMKWRESEVRRTVAEESLKNLAIQTGHGYFINGIYVNRGAEISAGSDYSTRSQVEQYYLTQHQQQLSQQQAPMIER